MKKAVLTLVLLFVGLTVKADIVPVDAIKHNKKPPVYNLMDYPDYKKITPENIKSIKTLRYTEAGIVEKNIEDKDEISLIYTYLKNINLLGETKYSCTDNTIIYVFVLNDGSKPSIEIECDWVVLKGKNYYIRYSSPIKQYVKDNSNPLGFRPYEFKKGY